VANLPPVSLIPVSLIPVANLPPVSLIPVASRHRDTVGKFAAGVVDTGVKLPPVSTTSAVLVAKFASSFRAGLVQLSEESHRGEIPRIEP
jgi:hypothetical protein